MLNTIRLYSSFSCSFLSIFRFLDVLLYPFGYWDQFFKGMGMHHILKLRKPDQAVKVLIALKHCKRIALSVMCYISIQILLEYVYE